MARPGKQEIFDQGRKNYVNKVELRVTTSDIRILDLMPRWHCKETALCGVARCAAKHWL